ncbi:MAG: RpiB/LacA/LacB family sugar-phosphate isomerase [Candidatus Aenigmatarchaeota archaeon]
MYEKVAIGCTIRRMPLKAALKEFLIKINVDFDDLGDGSHADVARKVAEAVAQGSYSKGILICGTGTGMEIAANKVPGVYAANCRNVQEAENSRKMNDANILTMGDISPEVAKDIVKVWLETEFSNDERFVAEIKKIKDTEAFYCHQRSV